MATSASKGSYFYGVGKRKTAVATVKLLEDGNGELKVNGKDFKKYFSAFQIENAVAPLAITDNKKTFDVEAVVAGGGKSAQSDAIRLGVSRALLVFQPDNRPALKREGFLRRDARIKERNKPGLKRARRAPQFSKR